MDWDIVIGIETHIQLKTKSKQFSGASTAYGNEPNSQACLVSLAYPGVLPVLNHESVNCAIKLGLAINAKIASRSILPEKIISILICLRGIKSVKWSYLLLVRAHLSINANEKK